MFNYWVIVQPKKGNSSLRPFVAGKMNMSSGKKGLLSIRPFLIGLLDNNRSAQLTKPPNVESMGNNKQC